MYLARDSGSNLEQQIFSFQAQKDGTIGHEGNHT